MVAGIVTEWLVPDADLNHTNYMVTILYGDEFLGNCCCLVWGICFLNYTAAFEVTLELVFWVYASMTSVWFSLIVIIFRILSPKLSSCICCCASRGHCNHGIHIFGSMLFVKYVRLSGLRLYNASICLRGRACF